MIRLAALVPDKSISHRAALISALAEGESRIENFSTAEDCQGTLRAVQSLGCEVQSSGAKVVIHGGARFGKTPPAQPLDLGNSGTGIRLLLGVLAGHPITATLTGDESLRTRPMDRIARPIEKMGAVIEGKGERCTPPVTVKGRRPLKALQWKLDPASAQVKSAILFASIFAEGETVIEEPTVTRDHTERMFASAGIAIRREGQIIRMTCGFRPKPIAMRIPEDFSAAAFFLALGLLSESAGGVELQNVGLNPTRTAFLDAVRLMGGDIEVVSQDDMCGEPVGRITARPSRLHGIELPVEWVPNLIDEIPVLSVLAACAAGKTVVRGAKELRVKESDRIKSIVSLIHAFSGNVAEHEDGFEIFGRHEGPAEALRPADPRIVTFADHRIAMSALIAGASAGVAVTVDNRDCINTSFPGFFDCLGEIHAQSHRH